MPIRGIGSIQPSGLRAPSGASRTSRRDQLEAERRAKRNQRKSRRSPVVSDPTGGAGSGGGPRDRAGSAPSPGLGGGGGGGTQVAPPVAGTDTVVARTPFGKRLSGAMGQSLYSNPQLLADEYMEMQGMNLDRGGGMTRVFRDMAESIPDLAFLTQGLTPGNVNALTPAGIADYAGQFLSQMTTPGSGSVAPSVVAPLFGGLHEDSPLSVLLNNPNLTPEDQVNVTLGLMQSGLTNSLPPALLSAILATGDVRGSEFIRNKMKGGQGTYQDWLRNSGLDEMLGI